MCVSIFNMFGGLIHIASWRSHLSSTFSKVHPFSPPRLLWNFIISTRDVWLNKLSYGVASHTVATQQLQHLLRSSWGQRHTNRSLLTIRLIRLDSSGACWHQPQETHTSRKRCANLLTTPLFASPPLPPRSCTTRASQRYGLWQLNSRAQSKRKRWVWRGWCRKGGQRTQGIEVNISWGKFEFIYINISPFLLLACVDCLLKL